ncbi:inositol monophosphatase, partial [Francisella tularensis subsp. holarctica]|nr:inositol monophosphatase [Francisella tularensis subsp. holarctica]
VVTNIPGTSDLDSGLIVAGNKKIQPKLIKIRAKHIK